MHEHSNSTRGKRQLWLWIAATLGALAYYARWWAGAERIVSPAFALPDTDGQVMESAELLTRGPLVVTLYRGHW